MSPTVPMLRAKTLDDRMTIPMEGSLKQDLVNLKRDAKVDVLEWIRTMIRKELPNLKKQVKG